MDAKDAGGAEGARGAGAVQELQLRRTLMAIIMRQQQLHHRKERSQGTRGAKESPLKKTKTMIECAYFGFQW